MTLDAFEEKVADHIRRHALFAGARRVLLAVSGGADSSALLGVLTSLRREGVLEAEFVCAHVNHGLRGTAGDEDEAFVVAQAARSGLPVATARIDVRRHAGSHRLSIETAARQLRLDQLCEMARRHNCSWIATGHQKNDNAETVLHRLWRGTGFRGLAGIWPARRFENGITFARPLLGAGRQGIVTYLSAHHLPWRQDHTNTDPAFTRNLIRHQLLPALQRQSGDALVETLSELATAAYGLCQRIGRETSAAQRALTQRAREETRVDASGLAQLPDLVAVELVRRELTHLGLGERDLSRRHYENILRLARRPTGGRGVALPQGFFARRRQNKIILAAPRAGADEATMTAAAHGPLTHGVGHLDAVTLHIPGTTRFGRSHIEARILAREEVKTWEIRGDKGRMCEYFDYDRVGSDVVVRARRAGDKFRPLGMAGEKKVGKFLTTARVPDSIRKDVLVVDAGGTIIWVCPVRISECVKVTRDTQRILRLKVVRRSHDEPEEHGDYPGDGNYE